MAAAPFKFIACPFCGRDDKCVLSDNADLTKTIYWVTCDAPKCGSDGPYRASKEAAVDAWNSRAKPQN